MNYSLTFTAVGLPSLGASAWTRPLAAPPPVPQPPVYLAVTWGLVIAGEHLDSSMGEITVGLPNGTYPYQLLPVPGYRATMNGTIQVNGSPVWAPLEFHRVLYTLAFVDRGLPPGTGWNVTLWVPGCPTPGTETIVLTGCNSTSAVGTGTLSFRLPNGTYAFSGASGFFGTVVGTVTVNGSSPPALTVAFDTILWLPAPVGVAVVVLAAVLAATAIVVRVNRRRRRRRPPLPMHSGLPFDPRRIPDAEFRVVDDAPPRSGSDP
jgi:hypothetical protein